MKYTEKIKAIELRQKGNSIKGIAAELGVARSSVSLWVRHIELTESQLKVLSKKSHSSQAVELRRQKRLATELAKRNSIIEEAVHKIKSVSPKQLWLIGVMLYRAEGGKTQRLVRFSNGDPRLIKLMMHFFRKICFVSEQKFRGYIHIHPHLDSLAAERYWSMISGIPQDQFFKTYKKPNKSSKNLKDTLPNGVFDIYVLDSNLFLKITGWAEGIFKVTKSNVGD